MAFVRLPLLCVRFLAKCVLQLFINQVVKSKILKLTLFFNVNLHDQKIKAKTLIS